MNYFLQDPNEIRLPPEEVRLTKVLVTPQPNGRQVKVHLELTPFAKRPNIEVTITSGSGIEVGHTTILETMLHKLEFTVHLRRAEPGEVLMVDTMLYYQKLPELVDTGEEVPLPDPLIVDRNTTVFDLPRAES
jgi:hypothetical protein